VSAANDARVIVDALGCHGQQCRQCATAERKGYGKVHCPVHLDPTPSLAVTVGDRVLVKCHGGCSQQSVIGELRRRGLWSTSGRRSSTTYTEYSYTDLAGKVLYQSVRVTEPGRKKRFFQRRPDGLGGWIKDMKGIHYVPYRLQQLGAAETLGKRFVFIVEGEKDADRLGNLGLVATTNIGGAGKWRSDYNRHFYDKYVVVLADNDQAGLDHRDQVLHNLRRVTRTLVAPDLPGLPPGGDISDWLDQGHTLDDLVELVAESPLLTAEDFARTGDRNNGFNGNNEATTEGPGNNGGDANDGSAKRYRGRRMSDIKPEPVEWLWEPRIPLRMVTVIEGDPDQGKSLVTIDLAARLSKGAVFPDGGRSDLTGKQVTLILSAEDHAESVILLRLIAAGADLDYIHIMDSVEVDGQWVPPEIPCDLDQVESYTLEIGATLIVIDVINAYLGAEVRAVVDQDVPVRCSRWRRWPSGSAPRSWCCAT
jgi:hypothetical protein